MTLHSLHNLEKVPLIFAKGTHPYSYLIRVRYQSRWSHVGVIIDGVVHEAVHPRGVVKTPLAVFLARYETCAVAYAYAEPGWEKRFESMVGLEYDFWGAAGMGIGTRRFDHPNKLWCSHHIGIGLGTFRPERMNRLSPEHIWMVTKGADAPFLISNF